MQRDLGVFGDVLNELLFDRLGGDVSTVVWLGEGRWLVADLEEPDSLYVVEMYPAKVERA